MIAVSGAGIAGMAAAVAVQSAGQDVTLIGTPPATLAGGIQLAPNGWAALRTLGVADAVASDAVFLTDIAVRDLTNLSTITRLPLTQDYGAVSRQHLHRCLTAQFAAGGTPSKAGSNQTGQKATAETRDDILTDIHSDGTDVTLITAATATLHVDALIAADGQSGLGRRFVLGEDTSRASASSKVALRAEIPADLLPARFSRPSSNLWLGNGMHVVHYPLGSTVNVVITLPAHRDDPDVVSRLFADHGTFAPLTNPAIKWARTPLPRASNAACWRRGNVVLAGDAAHIMPPHLAQGAGQSLEDAARLYQSLSTTDTLGDALSHYAVTRARAVARVADKADLSGQIMGLGGAAGRLRNIVLDIGGTPLMNGWLAEVWAGDATLAR